MSEKFDRSTVDLASEAVSKVERQVALARAAVETGDLREAHKRLLGIGVALVASELNNLDEGEFGDFLRLLFGQAFGEENVAVVDRGLFDDSHPLAGRA